MQAFTLDPKALLGGVFFSDADQELVQLALQAGNDIPPYQTDAIVLMVVLNGQVEVSTATGTIRTQGLQVLRFEPDEEHSLRALTDNTTVLVFKQLTHARSFSRKLRFGACSL